LWDLGQVDGAALVAERASVTQVLAQQLARFHEQETATLRVCGG
jgi:hypothetical protein